MCAAKKQPTRIEASHGSSTSLTMAIAGPLLGLVYILILPFVGLAAWVIALGYRARKGLAAI